MNTLYISIFKESLLFRWVLDSFWSYFIQGLPRNEMGPKESRNPKEKKTLKVFYSPVKNRTRETIKFPFILSKSIDPSSINAACLSHACDVLGKLSDNI